MKPWVDKPVACRVDKRSASTKPNQTKSNQTNHKRFKTIMKNLDKEQKLKILSSLYWDSQMSAEEAYDLLHKEPGHEKLSVDQANLYQRMLTTLDWYTILKLLPAEKLPFLLQDNVIQGIFPRDLQRKYEYVRSILCQ